MTGAAGFIGSHVVDRCLDLDFDVVALDDLSGGFPENVNRKARFVHGSVCDAAAVGALFEEERFRYVYHLAAYAAEGLSHFIRRYNYETNLIGSVNVINAAVNTGVEVLVFTSSIAVYGRNQLPMTEDLVPRPEDPYGISKYAVELDLKACHDMFGLDWIVFRPHNVYGERQNIADRYRNVIGIFMNQVLQGKPMTIFGDGRQTRAFSYIDDVAPIIARSVLHPLARNEVFNVGADTPYTVLELAHEVARAMQAPPGIVHLPSRNEVDHAYASHERLRRIFPDRRPVTTLRDGIERMAAWVRAHGPCEATRFGAIEVEKNLPPSWRAQG
ncbi:MAG: NAD-dependent epimerase/dehydratase family protein [Planctomycetes bacterium]|nr:NAD-dependent epimerase/dehydratase family protein [Planctomycetota bacterium]